MTSSYFPTSRSLLAPLLVCLGDTADAGQAVQDAVICATGAVPNTRSERSLLLVGNKQVQQVPHTRKTAWAKLADGRYLVRLVDQRGTEKLEDYWPRWQWEVTLTATEGPVDDLPAWPGAQLAVTRYKLSMGRLLDAQPLALFRHLFVEGLCATDPTALVRGGEHGWDDAWWPDPAEA